MSVTITTTWTENDLGVIEAAIASGTLRVKYADREIEYRSLKDLLFARDLILAALGRTGTGSRIYTEFDRGY